MDRRLCSVVLKKGRREIATAQMVWKTFENSVLFTLAVPTVTAEVAAAGVLQLAVALGADADHV